MNARGPHLVLRPYSADLATLVSQVCVHLDWIDAWPEPIARHQALEEVGVAYARHLARAMSEADVARALLDRPKR